MRTSPIPPVIWRKGAARLLAYYPDTPRKGAAPVLLVPSLINRYHIVDLEPERSFVRYLTAQGFTVHVMDWGAPGIEESAYNAADYVQHVLRPAVQYIYETAREPLVLAGYCMGGVFTLAAALREEEKVAALALIGTPWNFHSTDIRTPRLDSAIQQIIADWLDEVDVLPPEPLQMLFYWQEPWLFQQKFTRFAELTPGSAAFQEFLALEHWVNDGVPLARGVAKDCLLAWAQENALAKKQWKVGGGAVHPEQWKKPTFIAMAKHDHIVPPLCAEGLVERIPHATLCYSATGHVGMMMGSRAKREMWEPMVEWLLKP